ncbi:hybrid sensor histidine kinase/response regulator [Lachnospiraceae bacterium SGI.085]
MSHDIRTPLNGIMGLIRIDEAHADDSELIMENHAKMEVAANHLLSLINDVLQMSKLEDGSVELAHEPICLGDMTKEIVAIVVDRAKEAGIAWNYDKEKINIPYPYVYGSPLHLRQIFLNIYGNCIKYNRPDGKITTTVDAWKQQDGMCIYQWTITDTGIGLSQEFLKHVFEPFAQERAGARSKYQGTGLGMAIVKKLLDKMNGTISVTSEEGAEITIVGDGLQAVEQFKNSPADTYDAILMDVMMPVMDGITAAKEIRAINRSDAKRIPIIAMTANAFKEDAQKCFEAGMNAHLAKPLNVKMLKQTIEELTGKYIQT